RLALHPGSVVLQERDQIEGEMKVVEIHMMSLRFLERGLGLVEAIEPQICTHEVSITDRTFGVELNGPLDCGQYLFVVPHEMIDSDEVVWGDIVARVGLLP